MKDVGLRRPQSSVIALILAVGFVAASGGGAFGTPGAARKDVTLRSIPSSRANAPRFEPGEVLVHFRNGRTPSSAAAIGARSITALSVRGWKLVHLRGNESVDHAVTRLRSDARVDDVTPNHIYTSLAVPTDTLFPIQWGLQNTGQTVLGVGGTSGADISAVPAWDTTTGDSSVVVAVADSGVNASHPDLKPNVIAGRNFVGDRSSTDTTDAFGHGSHVAGIIGARGNDEYGVTGVAQHVSIMPIRVLDDTGQGDTSDIANGFDWAAAHGAKVINASFGGSGSDPVMEAAIQDNPNTLFVVAAGNASSNNDAVADYPCDYALPNLICVAASDQSDQLADFSNYGLHYVHLAAPGVDIASTYMPDPAGDGSSGYALSDSPDGGYADNADNWAQWTSRVDPSGRTNCTVNYSLRASLAPDDIFTVETAPASTPDSWTAAETVGGPSGFSTHGTYEDHSPAVASDGMPFFFRFHLTADPYQTSDGVYVDNVSVTCGATTLVPPQSFGSTLTGFTTGGLPDTWGTTDVAYTWVYMSGTSMATPFVSGAAALIWAHDPAASVAHVKNVILGSVDPKPAFSGRTVSGGRLNVARALLYSDDNAAPTGVAFTGTALTKPYQLGPSMTLSWTAHDSGTGQTGVKSYDIRYERAPFNGGFGAWTMWKSGTSATSGTFTSAPGNSYCFEVRALDHALNQSGWSGARCTSFPVNDTQMTASAGWSRAKSATRYLGTDSYTKTLGATLTLAKVDFRRMDLVVTLCSGCGSVAVYFGSTYYGTYSLNATTTQTRHLTLVRSFSHVVGPATVTIKVTTSGKAVAIEGLGVFRY